MERKSEFNLALISEAIAAAVPERECIVFRDRRLTWGDFQLRTRRLANFLIARGWGCHREREQLENFESGQDHLGICLYNGNEYLEAMVGSYKARVAPFNVNYRYVEDELGYLLRDADCRVLVYHARFAARLRKILPALPRLQVLLQVADESGSDLLPGALDYETALQQSSAERPRVRWLGDDLYILYTGGTTGMPKGVLWRQEDVFFGALGGDLPGGTRHDSVASVVEQAKEGGMRSLPAPPFMHGAAHWMAFATLHQGGVVVIQEHPGHLDPDDIWSTVEREQVSFLTIVGDAFGRPLLDQLAKRSYDLSSLRVVLSGGAVFSPALKAAFVERIPQLMIVDGFGASETGGHGTQVTVKGMESASGSFTMNDQTVVLKADLSGPLEPGSEETGWVARARHVPLGYLKDAEKTARTFPVVDGVRYAVPGDHARIGPDGAIVVLGRGSVSINSGGEKIYPEEVETALKQHPLVYDAVVVGTPHTRFGEQVTAIVQMRPNATVGAGELVELCSRHLARYKLPKAIVFVDNVVRSPSGKADYRWAKSKACGELGVTG